MSAIEDDRPEEPGDDILAAEFALGVLSGAEQATLARRVALDPEFARAVAAWEERLAPLAAGFDPVELPAGVKQALDRHLFGVSGPPPAPGLWGRLALWRGLAGASLAGLALALALPLLRLPAPEVMAALSAEGSDVHYVALYDAAAGTIRLARVSGEPAPGQVFQLWIAEGSAAPVSVGVIPEGGSVRLPAAAPLRALLTPRSHMAISLEPPGGSPTGQPTGAVVALGDLLEI